MANFSDLITALENAASHIELGDAYMAARAEALRLDAMPALLDALSETELRLGPAPPLVPNILAWSSHPNSII